jgi:hypothetical protein
MLSRLLFANGFALSALFAFVGVANAASERTKVGVGTFLLALGVMGFLFIVFLVKYYFGLAGVIPPPVEDDHSSHASHH